MNLEKDRELEYLRARLKSVNLVINTIKKSFRIDLDRLVEEQNLQGRKLALDVLIHRVQSDTWFSSLLHDEKRWAIELHGYYMDMMRTNRNHQETKSFYEGSGAIVKEYLERIDRAMSGKLYSHRGP